MFSAFYVTGDILSMKHIDLPTELVNVPVLRLCMIQPMMGNWSIPEIGDINSRTINDLARFDLSTVGVVLIEFDTDIVPQETADAVYAQNLTGIDPLWIANKLQWYAVIMQVLPCVIQGGNIDVFSYRTNSTFLRTLRESNVTEIELEVDWYLHPEDQNAPISYAFFNSLVGLGATLTLINTESDFLQLFADVDLQKRVDEYTAGLNEASIDEIQQLAEQVDTAA